jgi:hypothetical protein
VTSKPNLQAWDEKSLGFSTDMQKKQLFICEKDMVIGFWTVIGGSTGDPISEVLMGRE